MVDTALPKAPGKAGARVAYTVERLTEAAAIRPLLAGQRAYAAYAIGQLEPTLFGRSEWWLAKAPPDRSALVLHARGGLGPAFFALGDPAALDAILRLHPGPRLAFATFQTEHLAVMKRHFLLSNEQLMVRMVITANRFRGAAATGREGQAVRLGRGDVRRINRLYSADGTPSSYTARNIEEGVYYGLVHDGRLVSIAGTHTVAPSEGVAVVGNVFTHPQYRGRGFAAIVTSAVTAELLARRDRLGCPLVVLTVEANNEAALHLYRKLGYQDEGNLYETTIIRKDPIGLFSLWRRLLARRGRGKEMVVR